MKWTYKEKLALLKRHSAGETYANIGLSVGLSRRTVSRLCWEAFNEWDMRRFARRERELRPLKEFNSRLAAMYERESAAKAAAWTGFADEP